ncbi:guanylate kinase [Balneolaceae bacterium ANBcel3]|nr:guanylate kinase [Balneolaceae bacterium ANBcel3]
MKKGKIIILVAPSGAGKTTLSKRLLNDFSTLKFSVSATTRTPRPHEVNGKDYFFFDNNEFDKAISEDRFLEWESFYGGSRYGTLRSTVEEDLKKGYFVLFDIEVKGALNVKAHYGDNALAIFIKPPSDEVLKERLKNRGTENEESLRMRLERARMELSYADRFEHVIINDDLERCYQELHRLVHSFMTQ